MKKRQKRQRVNIKPCVCNVAPEVRDGWIYIGKPDINSFAPGFYVVCPSCGTHTDIRGTKNAAIRDWNHERVLDEPVRIRIKKRLRKCNDSVLLLKEYEGNWGVT